jgi:hypothetical protein
MSAVCDSTVGQPLRRLEFTNAAAKWRLLAAIDAPPADGATGQLQVGARPNPASQE